MSKKGFTTIVELMVVIILISVVAVIVTPTLLNTGSASKETLKTSKISAIKVAAMNYVESDIKKYSDCNTLWEQEDIKRYCKITQKE